MARRRTVRGSRPPQPMSAPARTRPAWPGDEDGRNFDGAVGEEPAEEKFRLAGPHVIETDRAKDDAVVEQEDDGAGAPSHAERKGQDGDLGVVGHQLGRERAFVVLQLVIDGRFLLGHAVGWIAQQMRKGVMTCLASGSKATASAPKREPTRVMVRERTKAREWRRKVWGRCGRTTGGDGVSSDCRGFHGSRHRRARRGSG